MPKKSTPTYIIFKLPIIKDNMKILREAWGKKYLTSRGAKVRITVDFSSDTMQARWEWGEIFTVSKEEKTTKLEFCIRLNYTSEGKERSPDRLRSHMC